MKHILGVYRHHAHVEIECESLREAVNSAIAFLDNGTAYPTKIVDVTGRIIWQHDFLEGDALYRLRAMGVIHA